MDVPRKHLGAHTELRAVSWLLEQGYEVFRNVSPSGPADIIVFREDEAPRLIDVKTMSGRDVWPLPIVTEVHKRNNVWLMIWNGKKFTFADPHDPARQKKPPKPFDRPKSALAGGLMYEPQGGWLPKEEFRGIALP
jgi:hypothetical protein